MIGHNKTLDKTVCLNGKIQLIFEKLFRALVTSYDKFRHNWKLVHGQKKLIGHFMIRIKERKKLFGTIKQFDVEVDDANKKFIDLQLTHLNTADQDEWSPYDLINQYKQFRPHKNL